VPRSLPLDHCPWREEAEELKAEVGRIGGEADALKGQQVHVQEVLSCKCGQGVVTAPAPAKVVDKGEYGPGLLAHVVTSKCADAMPLHRLARRVERGGVPMSRSTLADLFHQSASVLLPLRWSWPGATGLLSARQPFATGGTWTSGPAPGPGWSSTSATGRVSSRHCREPGKLVHHHLFPQQHELALWFRRNGVDIHKFTILIPEHIHRQLHSGTGRGGMWNQAWRDYIRSKGRDPVTPNEIHRQAVELIFRFELTGPVIPYNTRVAPFETHPIIRGP
jgi:hypothetical protein